MSSLRAMSTVLVAGALAAAAFTLGAVPAYANSVPYTDYAVTGSVGLCDAGGHAVTHGNINDKPFVARAVSSTAAVAPYDGAGRKATLVAYQPRQGANPGQWSGDTLTSSSTYTNPRYPMAQATSLDFSLKDFLNEFAPQWDGLIQLRIYLSAPQQPTSNSSYPATDIRVTGDTWSVVRGASVPCTDGSAKDSETVRTAPGDPAPGGAPGSGSTAASGGSPGAGSAAGAGTGTGSARSGSPATGSASSDRSAPATLDAANASAGSSSTSGSRGPVYAGIAALVAIGVGGLLWWRRRRA